MSTIPGVAREKTELREIAEFTEAGVRRASLSRPGSGVGALFAALDGLLVVGSGLLAYWFLRGIGHILGDASLGYPNLPKIRLLVLLLIYTVVTITCNAAQDLYADAVINSAQGTKRRIARAFCFSLLIVAMVVFVAGEQAVPRLMFAVAAVFGLTAIVAVRLLVQRQNTRRIERGIGMQHVLIVGAGEIGRAFHRHLNAHRSLGKKVCGFVDDERRAAPLWLGTSDALPRIVKEHFIDEIYFTPGASRDLIINVALQAREQRVSVRIVPDLYGGLSLGSEFGRVGDVPVLELNHRPIPTLGLFVKRTIDLLIATVLALGSAPVMLLTALAIKLDSPGPVIYKAWRVGRKGRKFLCYKFRTMVVNAEIYQENLRHLNERNGATFKISNDPRMTRIGRLLRKYSIDELPQVVNVFRGEMSIVGPRPHILTDFSRYELDHLRRLEITPGLTGLWQVTARRDPSFEKNVELDLEYINNWSLLLDVRILLRTVIEVLRGSGR